MHFQRHVTVVDGVFMHDMICNMSCLIEQYMAVTIIMSS